MLNPLLVRFAGEPSLVAPERRDRFEACLDSVMAIEHGSAMLRENAAADDGFWPEAGSWKAAYRPYVVVNGILQIPVKGVLLHDFAYAVFSFATGYVYIRRAFERGLADPNVKGIALVCDSPGGEVAGCFELADIIFKARGTKPVWAFAHESAYSAAYAVASAADRIVVSRTGGVGSIGVVTFHVDRSEALAKAGLKITFIHAPEGGHKVDGNSTESLPDDVKARIQARIDALYDVFVASVARNRGLKESAVRGTKALCFSADEAVRIKLAGDIGAFDDALAAFASEVSPPEEQDESMITPEAHEAAVAAARVDGEKAGVAQGKAEGRAEERGRIKAILGSEHAKGREKSAQHIALNTDLDPAAADGALAGIEKGGSLAARMEGRDPLSLDPDDAPNAARDAKRGETLKSLDPSSVYAARRAA